MDKADTTTQVADTAAQETHTVVQEAAQETHTAVQEAAQEADTAAQGADVQEASCHSKKKKRQLSSTGKSDMIISHIHSQCKAHNLHVYIMG